MFVKKYIKRRVDNDPNALREYYQLIFRQYCLELGWFNSADYPDEQLIDEYDEFAHHYGFYLDGEMVATIRVVFANPLGFPVERNFNVFVPYRSDSDPAWQNLDRRRIADSGRVATVKKIRRDKTHQLVFDCYKCGYAWSRKYGLEAFLFSADEHTLRMVIHAGILPHAIAPAKLLFGSLVTPGRITILELERQVRLYQPENIEYLLDISDFEF